MSYSPVPSDILVLTPGSCPYSHPAAQDIYRLETDISSGKLDGVFLYWYVSTGHSAYLTGSWRTSGGLTYAGGSADPSSKDLGCGSYYPAYKIPIGDKYKDFTGEKGWFSQAYGMAFEPSQAQGNEENWA